ncbi:expressed unknown protein [Seminavis robusta]|uniref:Uncharacterized protein n=1 Tax=Seminavis robusta TaxID=568900 RepID=A0A9N8E1Z8_9STRA|nr:expressed unknown protein [Seminavis robusta]|eukprot:Sro538_g162660.1 n/a (353) ;mRNA; r:46491-47549
MITAFAVRQALSGRSKSATLQNPSKLIEELAIFFYDSPFPSKVPVEDVQCDKDDYDDACCSGGGSTVPGMAASSCDDTYSASSAEDEIALGMAFASLKPVSYEEPIQEPSCVYQVDNVISDPNCITGSPNKELMEETAHCDLEGRRSAVTFHQMTNVLEIPRYDDYPISIQRSLWMSIDEVAEIAERGKHEYMSEGCHPELALEEDVFILNQNDELIHPETWRRQQEAAAAAKVAADPVAPPMKEIVCKNPVKLGSEQPLRCTGMNESGTLHQGAPRSQHPQKEQQRKDSRGKATRATKISPPRNRSEGREKRRRRRKTTKSGRSSDNRRGLSQPGARMCPHAPSLTRFADI